MLGVGNLVNQGDGKGQEKRDQRWATHAGWWSVDYSSTKAVMLRRSEVLAFAGPETCGGISHPHIAQDRV